MPAGVHRLLRCFCRFQFKKNPWMENVQNEDMSACEQILCKLVSRHEWLSCTVGGLGKPGIMLGMAVVPCLMTRAEHTPFWLLPCLWPIYSSSCNQRELGWVRLMFLVGLGQDSSITYRMSSSADMHELPNDTLLQRLSYGACLARKI